MPQSSTCPACCTSLHFHLLLHILPTTDTTHLSIPCLLHISAFPFTASHAAHHRCHTALHVLPAAHFCISIHCFTCCSPRMLHISTPLPARHLCISIHCFTYCPPQILHIFHLSIPCLLDISAFPFTASHTAHHRYYTSFHSLPATRLCISTDCFAYCPPQMLHISNPCLLHISAFPFTASHAAHHRCYTSPHPCLLDTSACTRFLHMLHTA